MLIGYARVSTDDQKLALQLDALEKIGCGRIFEDSICGAAEERPGLDAAMDVLREGDTLVVWSLDRLGRSLKHLISVVQLLESKKISFMSLTESIDTTTPAGILIFQFFGAIAEFQLNMIRERTRAGVESARKRGRFGGRPFILDKKKREMVVNLYDAREQSVAQICEFSGISKPTLYKYVRYARNQKNETNL
jgi:DNA invertase Pin-like site-specific DNA recombinase